MNSGKPRFAALIVAAGRGSRAATAAEGPKQYAPIGGMPVLSHVIRAFVAAPGIAAVQVVIHADDRESYDAALTAAASGAPELATAAKLLPPVEGGATRQASVLAGLDALAAMNPDGVLIHDAARPFVTQDIIARTIAALTRSDAAIAAIPLADTLKRATTDGAVAGTIDRAGLWCAQTPQAFRFPAIHDAHRRAAAERQTTFTDDSAVAEWAGMTVELIEGSADNIKLTTRADIIAADRKMTANPATADFETRTATGFDVHRFTAGDHVWLGGVRIAHHKALEGHSDADAPLHALTDALLGTIGEADIGSHFPPSDAKWKGAASILFLEHAARLIAERGGRIVNVDLTILAEAPKISPHRTAMQAVIGKALSLTPDRIAIKATTTEGLGFTGREEGIAAMATATVTLAVST